MNRRLTGDSPTGSGKAGGGCRKRWKTTEDIPKTSRELVQHLVVDFAAGDKHTGI